MSTTPPLRLSVLDQSPVPAGFTPADALANSLDLAQHVDRLGYTRLWYSEHHAMDLLACTAPEILIARAAAATERIRVGSGGIMLPHYSPLKIAEVFRTLWAMFPGRIDLGIGRAPGGGQLEMQALRRQRTGPMPDDFPQQLAELLAYLHPERFPANHPFRNIRVSPDAPGAPDLWLLGSSMWSAVTAAQEGLPYAFAHFFSAAGTRQAIEYYRRNFQPSEFGRDPEPGATLAPGAPPSSRSSSGLQPAETGPQVQPGFSPGPGAPPTPGDPSSAMASSSPKVGSATQFRSVPEATIAIGVICAPIQEEADFLHSSVRLLQRRIRANDRRPVAPPEEALRELTALTAPPNPLFPFTLGSLDAPDDTEWPTYIVGTPDRVAARLHGLASELHLGELIVNTITHDHEARKRSYTLLAEAMNLQASPTLTRVA